MSVSSDLLPNDEPLAPVPAPGAGGSPGAGRALKCEFCECQLTPNGEYLKLSTKARTLRDLEETLSNTTAQLSTATESIAQLTRELNDARAQLAARANESRVRF